jgi:uncharacterized protein (TIGR03067 family)
MGAKISIDGDRFVSTGMGAIYEGTVTIDAEAHPKAFDLNFTAGPEAGSTSYGIYQLEADEWRICLTTRGSTRPAAFATKPGSGNALEVLRRETRGPVARAAEPEPAFETVPELEGEWAMVSCTLSGDALERRMVKAGRRVVEGCEMSVLFGDELYAKARFTVNRAPIPHEIDYYNTHGPAKGQRQRGIFELKGDRLTLCLAAPGEQRPGDFLSVAGDGRTLALWKRK